jgi:hypothetical protein
MRPSELSRRRRVFVVTLCLALIWFGVLTNWRQVPDFGLKLSMAILWAAMLVVFLVRWIMFQCPNCQQRFFFPVMNRPESYVPNLLSDRCIHCGVKQ